MTADDWRTIVQRLASQGFRVVSVEPATRQIVLEIPEVERKP